MIRLLGVLSATAVLGAMGLFIRKEHKEASKKEAAEYNKETLLASAKEILSDNPEFEPDACKGKDLEQYTLWALARTIVSSKSVISYDTFVNKGGTP